MMKRILMLFFLIFLGKNSAAMDDIFLVEVSFQALVNQVIPYQHSNLLRAFQEAHDSFNSARYHESATVMDTIADYAGSSVEGNKPDEQLARMAAYMRDKLEKMYKEVER